MNKFVDVFISLITFIDYGIKSEHKLCQGTMKRNKVFTHNTTLHVHYTIVLYYSTTDNIVHTKV